MIRIPGLIPRGRRVSRKHHIHTAGKKLRYHHLAVTMTMADFPPNQALKDFEQLIGTWDTVGNHALIPGVTLHGKTTFSWHESGAFIIVRSSIQEDVGIPRGIAIIGSDDELGTYSMVYYDERGVSRTMEVSMEQGVLRWWRNDPALSQRYTLTVSKDGNTIVGKGEMSRNGSAWEKDLDLDYMKVGK